MTKTTARHPLVVWCCVLSVAATAAAHAQGRGGGVWTTSHNDAQRTSSVRTDPRISVASLSKPGFQQLWKRQIDPQNALTQPVFSTPGFITYKGFKGLAYLGSASETVYSVDYDLNKMFWTAHLSTASTAGAGSASCPGGLITITENTALMPPAPGGRGGGPGGGGAAGAPGAAAPGAAPGAPPVVAGAAPTAPPGAGAPGAPPGRGGGGGGGGGGGRGANPVYAVSRAGMLHFLNAQTGTDLTPPVKLLPAANAKVAGAIAVNNMFYVATADNCGGVANGVYAMDITPVPGPASVTGPMPPAPAVTPASTAVRRWPTRGGSVVGSGGPVLGTDGTVYAATSDGDLIALDGKTLDPKDGFTTGGSGFTSSPIVFSYKGKDLVAAANADARIYMLDSTSLGGADHRTPLSRSAAGGPGVTALSTFEDPAGARWLVAATGTTVAAYKVSDQTGTISIDPAWTSKDIGASAAPTIMNGVIFAVSNGTRGAVLHALELATGRELWNSGTAISAAAVAGIGPAANDSQVYVVTTDGTLYAFGFQVER